MGYITIYHDCYRNYLLVYMVHEREKRTRFSRTGTTSRIRKRGEKTIISINDIP